MNILLAEYEKAAVEGRVSRNLSPCGRYVAFKYSQKTSFERDWDFITLTSRGHVWDLQTGQCLGAPFDKFFNRGELSPSLEGMMLKDDTLKSFVSRWTPEQMMTATPWEKLDGSMGLVWLDADGEVRVNTPGSFVSEQAAWAMNWLNERPETKLKLFTAMTLGIWHSFCVEIIYFDNRVVVPYKTEDYGLYLTGATINPHLFWSGNELQNSDFPYNSPCGLWGRWASPAVVTDLARNFGLRHAKIIDEPSENLVQKASAEGTTGDSCEGWVFQIPSGARVKVKCSDYIALHRVVTNVHPNRVKDILEVEGCWGEVQPFCEGVEGERWEAAKIALRNWLLYIDEEYREPYERLVEGVISGVANRAVLLEKTVKNAHRVGLHTAADFGRAVAMGTMTLPKAVSVGQVCRVLRDNVVAVSSKEVFEELKARLFRGVE